VTSSYSHDERTPARVRRFLEPLLVLEVLVLLAVLTLMLTASDSEGLSTVVKLVGPPVLALTGTTSLWWAMRVQIRVEPDSYTLKLWPFWIRTRVPIQSIHDVYVREVRPLKQYGGWGVRWKPQDILYSVGGTTAATVEYHHKGKDRKLTVTTSKAEKLVTTIQTHRSVN